MEKDTRYSATREIIRKMKEGIIFIIGFILISTFVIWSTLSLVSSFTNMDSEIRTIHTFNMDNQTRDAIKDISEIQRAIETKCIVKEWDVLIEDGKFVGRYLANEYVSNNCSIVGE